MKKKTCTKCNIEKYINEFFTDKSKKSGFKSACKKCCGQQDKTYRKKNSEQIKIKRKKYYEDNKTYISVQSKEYRGKIKDVLREKRKIKYMNNHLHRLKCIVRRRINLYLKKKSKTSKEIIGCTYNELVFFLQEKFTEGMSWDLVGKEIHIDHIIPLSSATSEEEIYKLCHYTNLQPLWAEDNLRKSNKLVY